MYFKIYSHFKSLNIHLVDNGYRRLYIASRFWENFLTTSKKKENQKEKKWWQLLLFWGKTQSIKTLINKKTNNLPLYH